MAPTGIPAPAALPLLLIFFLLPLIFLLVGLSVGHAMGFSPIITILLFYAILVGSAVNIPLYERNVPMTMPTRTVNVLGVEYQLPEWKTRRSVVAVNAGGCLIPLALSAYFLLEIPLVPTIFACAAVTVSCYLIARPIPNIGIGLPMFVPVVVTIIAAGVSCSLLDSMADLARISFTAGVVGTIIGADLLHLRDMDDARAKVVSIGGAGTFDGIFLTGVFAALLSTLVV